MANVNNEHIPSPEQRRTVESMSAYGIPQEDICRVVGVALKTLRKHYRDELDLATAKANAKVAQTLFAQATDKENPRSATAAIFWLKTRGGWKETTVNELVGKDGKPIQVEDISPRERILSRINSLAPVGTEGEDT